ncbi:unnamed protein product [Caenorhabditis bovis]|uniref:Uncharacterized protein n=1 Tax=Caenorhabditis bovis TaxID=2654633 RepID=A0A8S1ER41_9PELO|nr:unnamed protein product [Caenorhabditis bovis]
MEVRLISNCFHMVRLNPVVKAKDPVVEPAPEPPPSPPKRGRGRGRGGNTASGRKNKLDENRVEFAPPEISTEKLPEYDLHNLKCPLTADIHANLILPKYATVQTGWTRKEFKVRKLRIVDERRVFFMKDKKKRKDLMKMAKIGMIREGKNGQQLIKSKMKWQLKKIVKRVRKRTSKVKKMKNVAKRAKNHNRTLPSCLIWPLKHEMKINKEVWMKDEVYGARRVLYSKNKTSLGFMDIEMVDGTRNKYLSTLPRTVREVETAKYPKVSSNNKEEDLKNEGVEVDEQKPPEEYAEEKPEEKPEEPMKMSKELRNILDIPSKKGKPKKLMYNMVKNCHDIKMYLTTLQEMKPIEKPPPKRRREALRIAYSRPGMKQSMPFNLFRRYAMYKLYEQHRREKAKTPRKLPSVRVFHTRAVQKWTRKSLIMTFKRQMEKIRDKKRKLEFLKNVNAVRRGWIKHCRRRQKLRRKKLARKEENVEKIRRTVSEKKARKKKAKIKKIAKKGTFKKKTLKRIKKKNEDLKKKKEMKKVSFDRKTLVRESKQKKKKKDTSNKVKARMKGKLKIGTKKKLKTKRRLVDQLLLNRLKSMKKGESLKKSGSAGEKKLKMPHSQIKTKTKVAKGLVRPRTKLEILTKLIRRYEAGMGKGGLRRSKVSARKGLKKKEKSRLGSKKRSSKKPLKMKTEDDVNVKSENVDTAEKKKKKVVPKEGEESPIICEEGPSTSGIITKEKSKLKKNSKIGDTKSKKSLNVEEIDENFIEMSSQLNEKEKNSKKMKKKTTTTSISKKTDAKATKQFNLKDNVVKKRDVFITKELLLKSIAPRPKKQSRYSKFMSKIKKHRTVKLQPNQYNGYHDMRDIRYFLQNVSEESREALMNSIEELPLEDMEACARKEQEKLIDEAVELAVRVITEIIFLWFSFERNT